MAKNFSAVLHHTPHIASTHLCSCACANSPSNSMSSGKQHFPPESEKHLLVEYFESVPLRLLIPSSVPSQCPIGLACVSSCHFQVRVQSSHFEGTLIAAKIEQIISIKLGTDLGLVGSFSLRCLAVAAREEGCRNTTPFNMFSKERFVAIGTSFPWRSLQEKKFVQTPFP